MNLDRCTPGQKLIVETLDAPLMVAAGAGSGKTFTLTQRIVNAFHPANGQPAALASIDEVLAITFTKKAAAELRSRIKALLMAEGMREAALAVDDAWISTIHGMASRILREHALELGLDPAFEVISESVAGDLRDAAVEQVALDVERSSDPLLTELLRAVPLRATGGASAGVVELALQLLARIEAMPDGFAGLRLVLPQSAPGELMRELSELGRAFVDTAAVWAKPTKTEQGMLDDAVVALELVDAWFECDGAAAFDAPDFDADAFRRAFYAFPPTSDKFHAKKDDADFFSTYRSEYARLSDEVESSIASRHAVALVSVARMIAERYAQLKGPSRLDNTDLLTRCAGALRDDDGLAASYREQFKLIMVDEFQDTDKLQVALISALAQPGLANVCTVGDAQQSIYRFRGADVNVFLEYRESLREASPQARFVELPDNFRSHGDVLALVDAVFSQPEVFGGDFLHLDARGPVNASFDPVFEGCPRIAVDVVHHKASSARATGVARADALRVAARNVAGRFAELRERGARAGDMALLLGGMTNAQVYADALREVGLESVIAGGSVFASSAEAQLVGALLRFAVNRADEQALLSILTSELVNISDDVLLALASGQDEAGAHRNRSLSSGFAEDGHGAGMGLSAADEQALALARQALARFVGRAQKGRAASALRGLLVETGLLDRLAGAGAVGLSSAGNYAKAIRLVRDFEREAAGIAGVSAAFADHLATAKEAPGSLATVEADFVRIMTVHSSKGLEFPHVAIAELGDGSVRRSPLLVENLGDCSYLAMSTSSSGPFEKVLGKLRKFDREGRAEPSLASAETPGELYAALAEHVARQTRAEAQRLLYVALTRASKSLLLSYCTSSNSADLYEKCGIYHDVFTALNWDAEGSRSVSCVDYGGSASARVSFRYLASPADLDEGVLSDGAQAGGAADDAGAGSGADAGLGADAGMLGAAAEGGPAPFRVSVREEVRPVRSAPCDLNRIDVRSYSSLRHDGVGVSRAAVGAAGVGDRSAEGVAGANDGGNAGDECAGSSAVAAPVGPTRDAGDAAVAAVAAAPASAAGPAHDDGARVPLAELARGRGDDEAALGEAFHRLAQRSVLAAAASAPHVLVAPDDSAIAAQVARCALTCGQEKRLRRALDRWFSSDAARRLAACERLAAEVPFAARVPLEGERALAVSLDAFLLEGEIDALGVEEGGAALIVDYKTGGFAFETEEQVRAKHLLQAQCYAYALLAEGFTHVEAVFVRVEHAVGGVWCAGGNAAGGDRGEGGAMVGGGAIDGAAGCGIAGESPVGEPQMVRYAFDASDKNELAARIASAYER